MFGREVSGAITTSCMRPFVPRTNKNMITTTTIPADYQQNKLHPCSTLQDHKHIAIAWGQPWNRME